MEREIPHYKVLARNPRLRKTQETRLQSVGAFLKRRVSCIHHTSTRKISRTPAIRRFFIAGKKKNRSNHQVGLKEKTNQTAQNRIQKKGTRQVKTDQPKTKANFYNPFQEIKSSISLLQLRTESMVQGGEEKKGTGSRKYRLLEKGVALAKMRDLGSELPCALQTR